MTYCAVFGCYSSSKKKIWGVRFHRFPKNKLLLKQWISACKRLDKINLKTATICSIHFKECFKQPTLQQRLLGYCPKNSRCLTEDAVPTEHLPSFSTERNKVSSWRKTLASKLAKPCYRMDKSQSARPKNLRKAETADGENKKHKKTENDSGLENKKKKLGNVVCTSSAVQGRKHVGCCVMLCSNTSESHLLTCLPLHSELRKKWITKISRESWTPSDISAVCQVHFAPCMWVVEDRVLRSDAFPTLQLRGEKGLDSTSKFICTFRNKKDAKSKDCPPDKRPFETVFVMSEHSQDTDDTIDIQEHPIIKNEQDEDEESEDEKPSLKNQRKRLKTGDEEVIIPPEFVQVKSEPEDPEEND